MENEKPSTGNLRSRVSSLLHKEATCDVEFLVGHPPGRYRCHRAILAAGSAVFEAMFFGALRQKSPVRVPDVQPRGFSIMLRYLYSDATALRDECDAWEAAYASKKYMIQTLFAACEDFLLKQVALGPERVLSILEEASFLEMRRLKDHCLRYVSRNARKVFLSKSFVRASRDAFDHVLSLELMDIESEREVIEALWLWGQEQCREQGLKCSVENVRDSTKAFLKHVRFLALTVEELVDVLERCQILDTSDEMALLWNVAMPSTSGLSEMSPDICTVARTRSISNSSKIQFPGQYRYDGSMTSFLIENHQLKVDITVTGSPVTVIGVVVAFKPIPCYSCSDRSLDVEISAASCSSKSGAKSHFKAEDGKDEVHELLLLDNYVVIEEQQVASLTVTVSGEGVRLMQCPEDTLCYDLGTSEVSVKFDKDDGHGNRLFPMKELMIA